MTIAILIISILTLAALVYLLIRQSGAGEALSPELENKFGNLDANIEKIQRTVSDEIYKNRSEFSSNSQALREELTKTLNEISSVQIKQLESFSKNLNELIKTNQDRMNEVNKTLKDEIRFLQEENSKKLEKMRETVDEKLQTTLEKRLKESFTIVSERLENVYKGLGEMRELASNVGDLKRVLTNVKSRGVFGELQLKNILEDTLTPDQYVENANIKKNTREAVEFAIKIPSRDQDGKHILLPVDSKFPREDYEAILAAQEKGDPEALKTAIKGLSERIKGEARDISEKYLDPPATTDFALMFLPTEGLFAETLRIPGLFEKIRKEYNIILAGPTTITAILNSLQMGFRTLAIEKRSSEVWKVLGAVKTEFVRFGDYLAKTREKLQQAADSIEKAEKRTQLIGKKLKDVEHLNGGESENLLELEENALEPEETEIEKGSKQ
ncbi:MAG: DNA recombination protein RmuC [Elusimicrobia bacterium CG08_land_8_20_14_0_20_51_18]|nr:MAG: DNA recombination protein RmuC [Elusimicrobia bacterium CG08_land_8_20_14_0_20_51_18]